MKFPKQFFANVLLAYLFWLLVFYTGKLIFIFSTLIFVTKVSVTDIFQILYHGFWLDLSTAGYFVALNTIFLFLFNISKKRFFIQIHHIVNILLLAAYFLVVTAEPVIYREWQTKINYKALTYLKNPSEIFLTADTAYIFFGLIITGVLTWLFHNLSKKLVITQTKEPFFASFLLFIFISGLNILVIRGGVKAIPINLSDAHFSNDFSKNDAAVNSVWNLIHSIVQNNKYLDKNPYQFMPLSEAKDIVKKLHSTEKDTTITVISRKTNKPNVVLIILESWTADAVKELGGYDNITPNFSKLCKEGLLFTQCYASGFRSDMGMAAILSGYPAQPTTTITEQPEKVKKLPVISHVFKNKGYKTAFIFGGQLIYGNIKSLILHGQYDKIIEGKDFPDTLPASKLAVHDEFVFQRAIDEINKEKEPFFYTIFTASSHSPYDVPVKPELHFKKENGYMQSVWYADYSIGKFMAKAKKQSWFNHTLFIFIADHSHPSPRQWEYHSKENKHIPLLWYGNLLSDSIRGKTYNNIVSQVDLAASLFSQLEFPSSQFNWSKNIWNPHTKNFAYYICGDGFGWVCPYGDYSYRYDLKRFIHQNFENDSLKEIAIKEGEAYLQVLFEDYLSK